MQSFIDHFYVCEDLSKLGPLDIQQYPTLQEAVTAYQTLPGDKVKALGAQNTLPMPGSVDFVQHLNGKDILLSDYLRLSVWCNAEIQIAVSQLQKLLPSVRRRTIRFITPEYKDLFALQDGESLKMRYMDGTTKTTPCFACSDGHHFYLGANQLFHICQFAEIGRANGTVYMPQTSHKGERADTYEIYQLSRYSAADYRFADYGYAKDKMKAIDYRHVYSGMLAKDTTLDDLYLLHNRDDRPFAHQMTSMSKEQITILFVQPGKRPVEKNITLYQKTISAASLIESPPLPSFLMATAALSLPECFLLWRNLIAFVLPQKSLMLHEGFSPFKVQINCLGTCQRVGGGSEMDLLGDQLGTLAMGGSPKGNRS